MSVVVLLALRVLVVLFLVLVDNPKEKMCLWLLFLSYICWLSFSLSWLVIQKKNVFVVVLLVLVVLVVFRVLVFVLVVLRVLVVLLVFGLFLILFLVLVVLIVFRVLIVLVGNPKEKCVCGCPACPGCPFLCLG